MSEKIKVTLFWCAAILFVIWAKKTSEGSPYVLFSNDGPIGYHLSSGGLQYLPQRQYGLMAGWILAFMSMWAVMFYLDCDREEFTWILIALTAACLFISWIYV